MSKILKDYPWVSLKPEYLDGKIDFIRIFGRPGPVHIEIGTGKAAFLLNQAITHSDTNFLGIEWAGRYYRYAVDRIGRWMLKNVRIIRTDAAAFLADFIPQASVDCFHIYFPDPWPKKRHHKRRFFSPANLQLLLQCLKQGGIIKVVTDHAEYFEQIQKVMSDQRSSLEKVDFLPAPGADPGEWIGTNFERKYLKENRPIYTIAVKKT